MSVLIDQVPEVYSALASLAHQAAQGYDSLRTLSDDKIAFILSHPDTVKVVRPAFFQIQLQEVDEQGFSVYNSAFTLQYTTTIDPENPTDDLSIPHVRPMLFGSSIYDFRFIADLNHGDLFYIAYNSGTNLPRIILVIVLDPTVT